MSPYPPPAAGNPAGGPPAPPSRPKSPLQVLRPVPAQWAAALWTPTQVAPHSEPPNVMLPYTDRPLLCRCAVRVPLCQFERLH